MKRKFYSISVPLLLLVLSLIIKSEKEKEQKPVEDNPPAVISATIPNDVSIPANFPHNSNPIAFFDDYSWRTFIALMWPAKSGQRGIADPNLSIGNSSPLVFETLKSDWEIFHSDGSSPNSNWNNFGDPVPCSISGSFGFNDLALVSTSKFGNLGQAGLNELVGPLVAQNKTYVRYLTGFNELEFNKIISDKLYLQANLNNVILLDGSIDVKSSWIEMTSIPHPERYYTRNAWVFDLTTNTCKKILVGLVGFHIAQKTPTRPQWIWSSFEQIDNIQQNGASTPFAFNDGTQTPMPQNNPISFPPPLIPPNPFNIKRVMPINPSTQVTNSLYQQALKNQGNSVWQFYQLIMTQWPTQPNNPSLPGTPPNTFPGSGATTSFANITMETFEQNKIQTGCMNCHNSTKANSDFLWSLKINAFPSILSQTKQLKPSTANKKIKPITDKSVLELKNLLEQNNK